MTNRNVIKAIILSVFEDEGPIPIVYWPESLKDNARSLIAMKTISLLMGDKTYQDGTGIEGVNYFGVIPFPDIGLNGLTYFFLIYDKEARGEARAATITIMVDQDNRSFFYENMKYLRVIIDRTATKIQTTRDEEQYEVMMKQLKEELFEFTSELKDPFSSKRKIKILFTGLDRAGKTSFLLAVKKKYSEIIKTLPTKGVERTQENLLSMEGSQISLWDLGGQAKYREKYFAQSKLYLYNVDLLFFFIDIQDSTRIREALTLFQRIGETLKELQEFPPVIVCLNKYDPDLKGTEEIDENITFVQNKLKRYKNNFHVKIFKTSIFDNWSVISAYSYGLSQLSPNRELFRKLLKDLSEKINAEALLLLNENGIILSDFSKDKVSGKVFEISAPHFQKLYKTFKEFKILEKDFIVSSGIADNSKDLIFKRIETEEYNFYLLIFIKKEIKIERIDKILPEFSKKVVGLIKTYI
jgi:GTPase SAR1 family protein